MKERWDRLVAVVDELVDLYRALLALSREKRDALVAVDTQRMDSVTKQEEVLIIRIGQVQSARENILTEIAQNGGLGETATMDEFLMTAGDNETLYMQRMQELDQIIKELTEISSVNAQMINQALMLINQNINLMAQGTNGPGYSSKGNAAPTAQNRSLFDRKA